MPVSFAEYERISLDNPDEKWELVCGHLRQKPPMTAKHEHLARRLVRRFNAQLPEVEFDVGQDSPKLRVSSGSYRVPDVCVTPLHLVERQMREQPTRLEAYAEPMPLVVEIWSPSTGDQDWKDKLREYQQRGDLEIWRIHPYDRTLRAWRRRPDGGYDEAFYRDGTVRPASLAGVAIDLADLFD